jgi:molybdopterin converting factor small subunit
MAVVTLRPPLRDLAGGREVEVDGTTVTELLQALERSYPRLIGWVLDDQGKIRQHIAVFVNEERATPDAPVRGGDRVHVLPSISGGAHDAEVLVGTRKGLFVLRGDRGGPMDVAARRFSGQTVEYAVRDPRSGRYFASVTHGQYGPRLFLTDDPLAETWTQADGPRLPDGEDATVERIWIVHPGEEDGVMWAGVAPAALFRSEDGGRTWTLNRALWDQPSRKHWQPGAGGLALHSICPWPGDPDRLAIGISAVGVWISDDSGQSWRNGNKGLVPRYVPDEVRETTLDLCVHNMYRSPLAPERLFMQFHGGVYRSDDCGETWLDIAEGLPSDFGFPLVQDPHRPDRAFVIPLVSDGDRVTPEGKVRVYETTDAGSTWVARGQGLPQEQAYLTVLRQAFGHDGADPLGLYFGATSGEVFGSTDGGRTWRTVAPHLAPVTSVRAWSA